jgi:hypothetical protein
VLLDPKQLEIKIVKNEKNMNIHIGEQEINSYYIKIKRDCILYVCMEYNLIVDVYCV